MRRAHQERGSVVGERVNLPRAECPFWVISGHKLAACRCPKRARKRTLVCAGWLACRGDTRTNGQSVGWLDKAAWAIPIVPFSLKSWPRKHCVGVTPVFRRCPQWAPKFDLEARST